MSTIYHHDSKPGSVRLRSRVLILGRDDYRGVVSKTGVPIILISSIKLRSWIQNKLKYRDR